MLFNLLNTLTDPDNIPGGYGGLDMGPIWALILTVAAIAITITAAGIIYYLVKKCENEVIKNMTWIKPTIIIVTIAITILLIIFGYFACTAE